MTAEPGMEVLRPVGGEGSTNPGRSSVCVHYRGPEGHRGGIMTAAVRAPGPSSVAPQVGTAGSTGSSWPRGSFLPCDLRAVAGKPPPRVPSTAQALPLPRAPVTAERTPQGSPEPVAHLRDHREPLPVSRVLSHPGSGPMTHQQRPLILGCVGGPPWPAQQPVV